MYDFDRSPKHETGEGVCHPSFAFIRPYYNITFFKATGFKQLLVRLLILGLLVLGLLVLGLQGC
jgi:hypothetical protein